MNQMEEANKTSDTSDNIKKERMVAALEKSLGIVTNAAKAVGISRNTHYRWMKEDTDYKKSVNDLDNVALDFAESKLHESIFEGNIAAIIFFLKTKGKVRGYIERQELDIKTDKPDLSGLTTEELMALASNEDNG